MMLLGVLKVHLWKVRMYPVLWKVEYLGEELLEIEKASLKGK